MKLIDTQILSYKYKGSKDVDIKGNSIPSIVALEFLLMQSDKFNSANYYVPNFGKIHIETIRLSNIDHPFGKRTTDNILFDFGQFHPSFQMFSNYSISELINNKNISLFDKSIQFLEKSRRKLLKKKIQFLFDFKIQCQPINEMDIETGYYLLNHFIKKHKTKNNFKNTWNDILILSKSRNSNIPLITEDKLLNRFGAELYNVKVSEIGKYINLDFTTNGENENSNNSESKGYINKGWDYKIRKQYAP